jgi:hypothetical protein
VITDCVAVADVLDVDDVFVVDVGLVILPVFDAAACVFDIGLGLSL